MLRDVENNGILSPLVINTIEGIMGQTAHVAFKRIASLLAINSTCLIIILIASFDDRYALGRSMQLIQGHSIEYQW